MTFFLTIIKGKWKKYFQKALEDLNEWDIA
jgi:hypothetical protein